MARKREKKAASPPNYERFGLIVSIIGLAADLIALATFGYSFVARSEQELSISIILWIGILSIIPLTYAWGYLSWIANSKLSKPKIAVLAIGISFCPFYLLWGAVVLAEAFGEGTHIWVAGKEVYKVTTVSRALGGLFALILQMLLALIILGVVMLWNRLLSKPLTQREAADKG